MVAGHLQEKNGRFYAVLTYTDENGKKKSKWVSTGLTVKGNKKRAEAFLQDARQNFKIPQSTAIGNSDLFADYLDKWLTVIEGSIAVSTFASYSNMVRSTIAPYFREKNITLDTLTTMDIQSFYAKQIERVKANTVIHYHAILHKALKYATMQKIISNNPMDQVIRPRKNDFVGSFYSADEVNNLLEVSKGTVFEIPIMLSAFYGLRKSEVLGLKWDAIDFVNDTISIRHKVTSTNLNGKHILIQSDDMKTKASKRTMPLVPFVKDRLLEMKQEQAEQRKLCGKSYVKEYRGYVCVNQIGDLIKPNYISSQFPRLLEKNNLRHIRFHDLRHTCASLLIKNGVPMKHIQEWLGHSDFATTANIYTHLEYSSKLTSASAMLTGLSK